MGNVDMVTKYVRKDFRDSALGVQRNIPPVQRPLLRFPNPSWTRVQVLCLLALICALLILDGLQKRQEGLREEVSVSNGVVVAKYVDEQEGEQDVFRVELEMPLDGEVPVSVSAVCDEELWKTLHAGTSVQVHYYTVPRNGNLVIRTIESAPVDAGHAPAEPSTDHGTDSPGADSPGASGASGATSSDSL
jgi:hypothetical protein